MPRAIKIIVATVIETSSIMKTFACLDCTDIIDPLFTPPLRDERGLLIEN